MIFIPENVEHFRIFLSFFFAGFRRDAAGPEIIVVDMNVEDSFLVRDDLDNALFLDLLKEAEGFGSAPLEELAYDCWTGCISPETREEKKKEKSEVFDVFWDKYHETMQKPKQ